MNLKRTVFLFFVLLAIIVGGTKPRQSVAARRLLSTRSSVSSMLSVSHIERHGATMIAGTLSGGWGFRVWNEYDESAGEWEPVRYSPYGAEVAIVDHSITNHPVFDVSDAEEMIETTASLKGSLR